MKIKKNDTLMLSVEDITNLGFGVAKLDGQVIFISDTVPGDLIEAKIIKTTSSFAVGRVEKIIKSSPLRTGERCSSSMCKSCAYKMISYTEEKRIKEDSVRGVFKKSGLGDIEIRPIIGSPCEHGYRNKAQYPIAKNKNGEYIIGFYAPKSHRVTEAADCPLAPTVFSEILELLRRLFARYELSVYDEGTGDGLLRHVYLRRGEVSHEVLVTLVINGDVLPHSEEIVRALTKDQHSIVGVLLNTNREMTNVVLGENYVTLYGRDYINDTLSGVELKITAPSFYQVNHDCAELLYAMARELAAPTKDDTVLDLYCGAGSIGLSMAHLAKEIIGIEIVESAVECAKYNAERNGIKNASFYTGDAKNTEKLLAPAEKIRGEKILPDIVILDPPRGGCAEELLRYVACVLKPRKIVYISCNPATLARDTAYILPFGFTAGAVTPVDMFPGTGHVESVVCLTRRLDVDMRR